MLKSNIISAFAITLAVSFSVFANATKLSGKTKCLSFENSSTIQEVSLNDDSTFSNTIHRYKDGQCKSLIGVFVAKGTYELSENQITMISTKLSFFRKDSTPLNKQYYVVNDPVETSQFAADFESDKAYESKGTVPPDNKAFEKPRAFKLVGGNQFNIGPLEYLN